MRANREPATTRPTRATAATVATAGAPRREPTRAQRASLAVERGQRHLQWNAPPVFRLTMPPKFLSKYFPDAEAVRSRRIVTMFGRWLQHPSLWRFNRRSVPGAVAIGLFAGLIPGPLQMLTALLLAAPLRKNIPVALLVTLYTNPVTIVPLYVIAFEYGNLL